MNANDAGQRSIRFYWLIVRRFYVYILASHSRRLYIGVTNDLVRRVYEHTRNWSKFTSRYHITRLVYYEICENPISAIRREKRLKKLCREEKIQLIESVNSGWLDLSEDWFDRPSGP